MRCLDELLLAFKKQKLVVVDYLVRRIGENALTEDHIFSTLLMRWDQLDIRLMSQNQFARCIGRLSKKFSPEEAKNFYMTAKDMVSTKKKESSAVEKEGLDYIAKRLKIKN